MCDIVILIVFDVSEASVLVNTIEAMRVGCQKLGDNTFMEA